MHHSSLYSEGREWPVKKNLLDLNLLRGQLKRNKSEIKQEQFKNSWNLERRDLMSLKNKTESSDTPYLVQKWLKDVKENI